jgi:deoxyribonuclease V
MPALFAVTDVHYPPSGGARAAVVLAQDARFEHVVAERAVDLDAVAEYQPGRFYLRELPALRAVLEDVGDLSLLIVDGYVDLEPDGRRPGLGSYCYQAFGVPVIGVAKTAFQGATHAAEVRRGASIRPLYVTAAGLSVREAATAEALTAANHACERAQTLGVKAWVEGAAQIRSAVEAEVWQLAGIDGNLEQARQIAQAMSDST